MDAGRSSAPSAEQSLYYSSHLGTISWLSPLTLVPVGDYLCSDCSLVYSEVTPVSPQQADIYAENHFITQLKGRCKEKGGIYFDSKFMYRMNR